MNETSALECSVMLVDDHAIWRGGVKSMLAETEFVVVGEAASGEEALEVARRTQPRLTLLDIRMAGGDGLATLVALKRDYPQMAIVMLTTHDNPTYMARAVAGGADGYLLKGMPREEMLNAMRTVAKGETLLSGRDLVRSLQGMGEEAVDFQGLIEPLTEREQEVLSLMATGLSNRDIGAVLLVSKCTAKSHVEHIIGKLGVSDRVQAAVWAIQHGLTPLPK